MKSDLGRCAVGFVLAVFAFASVEAEAEGGNPTRPLLVCEQACPPFTKAEPVSVPAPQFPAEYRGLFGYVEALVDVSYSIGTHGDVKNPFVESLVGSQPFADAALATIRQWKFAPAAEDDKPVEE